jgi:Zn-dependent protease
MAFITIGEIIDIAVMILAIGYIFSGFFKKHPKPGYDPLTYYSKSSQWDNIKHAAMIAAPAVVLHELAHKFVAMAFGATATLHAPYMMYAIVVLMRALNFPLIFFVGGYVAHTALPALPSALVSVAGPLTNLIVWFLVQTAVKQKLIKKNLEIWIPMSRINLFLAIFNMIPLPGFDGYHFFASLIRAIV